MSIAYKDDTSGEYLRSKEKPIVRDPHSDNSLIYEAVQDYIDFIDNDKEYHEDGLSDYKNQIFEVAIMHCLGEDVWEWINNRRK